MALSPPPWHSDPSRHGCLVSWSRNKYSAGLPTRGDGMGVFLGTHKIRIPGSPERGQTTLLEVLDAESGRILTLETWRVAPLQ